MKYYAFGPRRSSDDLTILVDDSDRCLIDSYDWIVKRFKGKKYHCTWDNDRQSYIKLHQLILGFPKYPVKHINGNTLDNRRCNLTNSDNGNIEKHGRRYRVRRAGKVIGYTNTREEAERLNGQNSIL